MNTASCVVVCVVCVACAVSLAACGLKAGERFGRSGAQAEHLRIQLPEDVVELDPARAHTPLERALVKQLFAPLFEIDAHDGEVRVKPALATSWELLPAPSDGSEVDHHGHARLIVHLRDDARFSDHTPLGAHELVWSWRRALRPSTGADDLAPLSAIAHGADLARGALLRIGSEGVRLRPPPYAVYREGAGDVVSDAQIPAGTPVHVVETNERVPCCGVAVPLHVDADFATSPDAAPAPGALQAGEVAVVAGSREVVVKRAGGGAPAPVLLLQLRAPGGAGGWARADDLSVRIPSVGLVHVVARGAAGVAIRAGPDDDAPTRAMLNDDDLVELVERGPDRSIVVDAKSGRTGWLPTANIDETVGERRWFLVEPLDIAAGESPRALSGWVQEQDLAFDPSLLDVHAVDEHTLDVGLAKDHDALPFALVPFAEPVMRAVPPRVVEEDGRQWTMPESIVTSGPFFLAEHDAGARLVLERSPTSFERARARLASVELIVVNRTTTALHLYRAGDVDVLLDGALPKDLAPTLARASDFVPGLRGGGLVAPEVKGLSPITLELRDVAVIE